MAADADPPTCEVCADPTAVYLHTDPLDADLDRHAYLYRCGSCGTLYEVFAELTALPRPISLEQAAGRFADFTR